MAEEAGALCREQGIDEFLPGAIFTPGFEVIPDGALGEQIMGQIVPLDASTILVEQRVDHLPQIDRTRTASGLSGRQQRLDDFPLLVRQI